MPVNLQGLNVVHPAQDAADSQELLLGHGFPDLSAQLDLWTNLSFSEEPLSRIAHEQSKSAADDEDDEQARSPPSQEKAVRDGHVNVVAPTSTPASATGPPFDLGSFLAGFGLDSFNPQASQQSAIAPSLAQLLALHPSHNPAFAHVSTPQYAAERSPSVVSSPEESTQPAKRARARKSSVSTPEEPVPSAAEDKRRRNTAASARFRLKKKEREAALESKAKELENKVSELERECEGLRRENGWLKGLVVGVTGAAQAPSTSSLAVAPSPASIAAGSKRRRSDDSV